MNQIKPLKFNIGEYVKVTEPGESWPRYSVLFTELGFIDRCDNDCDKHDKDALINATWVVFNRKQHLFGDGGMYDGQTLNIYGVETELNNSKVQLLIDEVALTVSEPIAWPREKAIKQCKELMNKLVEIINIYNFTEEDFKP